MLFLSVRCLSIVLVVPGAGWIRRALQQAEGLPLLRLSGGNYNTPPRLDPRFRRGAGGSAAAVSVGLATQESRDIQVFLVRQVRTALALTALEGGPFQAFPVRQRTVGAGGLHHL